LSPVWDADLSKVVPKMVTEMASGVQMVKVVAVVVGVGMVVEAAGVAVVLVVVILVVLSSPSLFSTCLFSTLLLPKSLSSTPY
jgi:hypothetical protein